MKFDYNKIKDILVVQDELHRFDQIIKVFPNAKITWVDTTIRAKQAVAQHNSTYDLIILDRQLQIKNHGQIKIIQSLRQGDQKILKDILKNIQQKVIAQMGNRKLVTDQFAQFLVRNPHLNAKYVIVYSLHTFGRNLSKILPNAIYIPFVFWIKQKQSVIQQIQNQFGNV